MSSYSLFVALWSAALLIHQALRIAFRSYSWFDVGAAALFALGAFLPRARLILPVVAIVQLISLWIDLPAAANHWMLAGFVNLTMLGTLVVLWRRHRRGERPGEDEIIAALGPVVRLEIILVYLIAAFHKLNSDFLNPDVGCLGWLAHWLANRLGIAAIAQFPRVVTAAAYGTIVLEVAIPVLLARRRTWFYGVALGILFHLANMETGFAAVAFALYFFFFPSSDARTIAQGFDEFLRERSGGRLTLAGIIRAYVLLFLLVLPSIYVDRWAVGSAVENWIAPVRSALWITALVLFFGTVLRYFLLTGIPRPVFRPERAASRGLYVIPLVLFVNGMGPYLGLKTTTSFDMFSNLRVLGDQSNHLLLRNHPLRIFGRLSDRVAVKAASDPALAWISAQGPLPYVQFRRELQARVQNRRFPFHLLYERNGRTYRVYDAATDAELMAPESVFARKLLPIRQERWTPQRACPW